MITYTKLMFKFWIKFSIAKCLNIIPAIIRLEINIIYNIIITIYNTSTFIPTDFQVDITNHIQAQIKKKIKQIMIMFDMAENKIFFKHIL